MMTDELINREKDPKETGRMPHDYFINIYPEMNLLYLTSETVRTADKVIPADRIIQITHCRSEKMVFKAENDRPVELKPGDILISSVRYIPELPEGFKEGEIYGLTISIDQNALKVPPGLLSTRYVNVYNKYCSHDTALYLSGNCRTTEFFSDLYDQWESDYHAHKGSKILILLSYLEIAEIVPLKQSSVQQSEQREIVKKIHDRLVANMSERITIEELAKQYHINTTTLKTVFKHVYGSSISAHIKEHRMEEAGRLLCRTNMSICEIAKAVGYDSQSKFTAAFKAYFGVLPRAYRKN